VPRLTAADVAWADVIFVMKPTHKRRLTDLFPAELAARPINVLDIPNEYQFMDPELIALLESGVQAVIGEGDVV
jgi:predicted protein tyrosine phosphatase